MTNYKSIQLTIIPYNIQYILSINNKKEIIKALDDYPHFSIEGFSHSLETYDFITNDSRQLNYGIFSNSHTVEYNTTNNHLKCSCNNHNCPHIYFIILYFSGVIGLKCYLANYSLDTQCKNIFLEQVFIGFELKE